jgi:hypothetical protein
MGRIDDTYLLLLECSLVHRDGLGVYFRNDQVRLFFLSMTSDLAYLQKERFLTGLFAEY